ncbi:MAG: type II toxin-antitoxin system HicB family antitoxin [archaeon]|nr:type II toxin-antitoxin system HicB family antitoxin [archaeon]
MKDMEIISFPIIITRENEWFVAACPVLDIATQGKTEDEVKRNMKELIEEYIKDPDTSKPELQTLISASVTLSNVSVDVGDDFHGKKAAPVATA